MDQDFQIEGLLGEGAMATVYAVRHRASGALGAAKFLKGAGPRERDAFLHEARALATLSHPNVVTPWDLGIYQGSDPRLPAGAPYLVLERGAGELDPDRVDTWDDVLALAADALAGLGHLHGRGFVHRDIKPANLLHFPIGLKIADLGVAVGLQGQTRRSIAGTPDTMAPEQLQADARDLGPWTDLFGLAATLWRVLTGTYPFPRDTRGLPVFGQVPVFAPRLEVPAGAGDWLRDLLAFDAFQRPPSAAHALHALLQLGTAVDGPSRAQHPGSSALPTMDWDAPSPPEQPPSEAETPMVAMLPIPAVPLAVEGSPLPERCRGLVGLRPAPLCGREEAQRALWARARAAGERMQAVLVTGPPGSGRTRLATWLASELHARCGARDLVIRGGAGGVGDVLRLAYGLDGLGAEACRSRLFRVTRHGDDDPEARVGLLMRLLGFERTGPPPPMDLRVQSLRLATVRRGLVVLVLDEAEAEWEAVTVARELLDAGEGLPLLVVATARPGGLPTWEADPRIEHVQLDVLPAGSAARAAIVLGAPLAEQRELAASPPMLPSELVERFQPQEAGDSALASRAVQLAAVLGHTFHRDTWSRAAAELGLGPDSLGPAVQSGDLVPVDGGRLSFRSSVIRRASLPREPAEEEALHAACLGALPEGTEPGELARHAQLAGRVEQAIELYEQALAAASTSGEERRAGAIAEQLAALVERVGGSPERRARYLVMAAEAGRRALLPETLRALAEEALRIAPQAPLEVRYLAHILATTPEHETGSTWEECHARAAADPEVGANLIVWACRDALVRGEVRPVREALAAIDASRLLERARQHHCEAMAELCWQEGQLAEGRAWCELGVATWPSARPCRMYLGHICFREGDLVGARRHFETLWRQGATEGLPLVTSTGVAGLALVLEAEGELAEAARVLAAHAESWRVMGSVQGGAPAYLNLALFHARHQRLESAELACAAAREMAITYRSPAWSMAASITLLACLPAGDGRWAPAIERATHEVGKTAFRDPDLAQALELARPRCPGALEARLDALLTELTA